MEESLTKQPLKILEIPLSKFTEVIPYYQTRYDNQKVLVHKLLAEDNSKDICKEMTSNKRALMQLEDLLHKLNDLMLQVEDQDIEKFKAKTLPLRRSIVTLSNGYIELSKLLQNKLKVSEELLEYGGNPFEGMHQIQISENLDDLKLQDYNDKCARVEALHEDVKDLHAIFGELNEMVQVQGVDVQEVEECVESTANNVDAGLKHLQVAQRFKTATYPMTFAVFGGMVGGPVGMVAGAKVGGVMALCCAFAGYIGGKFFKNVNEEMISRTVIVDEERVVTASENDKKTL